MRSGVDWKPHSTWVPGARDGKSMCGAIGDKVAMASGPDSVKRRVVEAMSWMVTSSAGKMYFWNLGGERRRVQ